MKADSSRSVASVTPRSAATRAKLLNVAERLFSEKGFEAVSVNEISRAAHQRYKQFLPISLRRQAGTDPGYSG